MKKLSTKRTGLPVGMWLLGGSSGHVASPAPTCAKCCRADWAHPATDCAAFVPAKS